MAREPTGESYKDSVDGQERGQAEARKTRHFDHHRVVAPAVSSYVIVVIAYLNAPSGGDKIVVCLPPPSI